MEVQARAPGKVILSGEHAVVHGYAAVAASLGMYTRCHIRRSASSGLDETVSLYLSDLKLQLQWSLEEIKGVVELAETNDASADLIAKLKGLVDDKPFPEANIGVAAGVMAFLFLYVSILRSQPSIVTITSELPLGAGLGSSASFCVSMAAAMLAMAEMLDMAGCEKIQDCEDPQYNGMQKLLKLDENGLELINKWAFEGEKIIHGRPSGIDNTVSTFGYVVKFKKGHLTRLRDNTPVKMLLTNTKVGRNTKALVAGVAERAQKYSKAMTAVFEATDAIAEEITDILQSFSRQETSRSEQGTKLEELVEMNQGLLQSMGVSHPSVEAICRTTSKYQMRSKLTGAGGGGCVLTVIPEQMTSKTIDKVKNDLEAQGYDCFEAAIAGPGVQVAFVPPN